MALPQAQQPANIEEYVAASTLQEALRALADGAATPVAGGTDLWVQKDLGVRPVARRLVNIKRVPEIAGISRDGSRIRLGALTTMTEILESGLLRENVPLLPATADRFASVQVRNAATVGGNIVNASPAADMVIPLLCLDAEIELASWSGKKIETRRLKLAEFFTGPGKSKRRPEELLTSVDFEAPGEGFRAGFCKTGPRPALEIAVVSLAFATYLKNGTLSDVRIALGAVAPTPIRCPKTEAMLQGKKPDDATIAGALDILDGEISPIGDHRSSEWYRRRLARVYLEQELSACR
ncbi:MAG: FAD binding domain-containing protein [Alphaproteobacteria bacterium]